MFRKRSKSVPKKPSEKAIFKKFLDFLQSSIWQLPTSMFIEQNSIVFDRDQLEPNLFKSIHNQFAEIVDSLISAHCEDAKITPVNLVDALKSVDKNKKLTFRERVLLEPVVAAQDFNVFVPMMMRKNVELQLQALKLMQHVTGMIPKAMTLAEEDAMLWDMLQDEDECEKFILISVIRKSREDYINGDNEYWTSVDHSVQERTTEEEEILKSIQEQHNQGVDEAIIKNLETGLQQLILKTPVEDRLSPKPSTTTTNRLKTPSKDEKMKEKVSQSESKSKLTSDSGSDKTTSKTAANSTGMTITAAPEKPPIRKTGRLKSMDNGKTVLIQGHSNEKKRDSIAVMENNLSNNHVENIDKNADFNSAISPTTKYFDYRTLLKEKEKISEEQIKARAEYLRQQRDKLLELKKAEKEKQLKEQSEKFSLERPKTAKAARAALNQKENKLETRKAIASKLKTEVVEIKK